jgi:hypothetical protein
MLREILKYASSLKYYNQNIAFRSGDKVVMESALHPRGCWWEPNLGHMLPVFVSWWMNKLSNIHALFTSKVNRLIIRLDKVVLNQSTESTEFVWVSECQKGEGCEIINQFVFV